MSRTTTPASPSRWTTSFESSLRLPRDEGGLAGLCDDLVPRSLEHVHQVLRHRRRVGVAILPGLLCECERLEEPVPGGGGDPPGIEAARARLRLVGVVVPEFPRPVGGHGHAELLDALGPDVERPRHIRAKEPFLRRDGVEVAPEVLNRDGDCTRCLGAVHEHGNASHGESLHLEARSGEPGDLRERDQLRPLRDRRLERAGHLRDRQVAHRHDLKLRPRCDEAAEEPRMLGVRGHDLVARSDLQPVEDDVAALRRRRREGDGVRRRLQEPGERRAQLVAAREHRLEVLLTRSPLVEISGQGGLHRLHGPARQRAVRAGVEIREALENGKAGANGV